MAARSGSSRPSTSAISAKSANPPISTCAGATLFYLLTGKYPYLGFDPHEPDSYQIILQHPPLPLRAFRPDAPEGMERILLKSLQKQPKDRWKSAGGDGERPPSVQCAGECLNLSPTRVRHSCRTELPLDPQHAPPGIVGPTLRSDLPQPGNSPRIRNTARIHGSPDVECRLAWCSKRSPVMGLVLELRRRRSEPHQDIPRSRRTSSAERLAPFEYSSRARSIMAPKSGLRFKALGCETLIAPFIPNPSIASPPCYG